jgi:hypothetical protein
MSGSMGHMVVILRFVAGLSHKGCALSRQPQVRLRILNLPFTEAFSPPLT